MTNDINLNLSPISKLRAWLNPNWLIKREEAAYLAQLINVERKRSAFKAAESNRLNAQWSTATEAINTVLQRELPTMRNRSRWLLRNAPGAVSGMNAFLSYCIGTGIRPIATVHDKARQQDANGNLIIEQIDNAEWNESCDDLWDAWAENADVIGTENSPESFYDVQKLALRKWIEDGETFIHVVQDKGNGIVPMYVEFFEPENLDTTKTENGNNGNKIVMGIEISKTNGRPEAYWVKTDATKPSKRYPASDIFHIYERLRPGQTRGFPWFHAVTQKFFQLDEYEDAELLACKIAACLSVFIERPSGMTPGGDLLPGDSGAEALDADGNKLTHVQPGMIGSVPRGGNVHVVQPQKPSATFDAFTKHTQRAEGAGMQYGLSFEALTRNTSEASYAGGRLAIQRDYQAFRQIIQFINRKFNRPFRNHWLNVAITARAIDAPGYFQMNPLRKRDKRYWRRHEWIPPAWQYGVNPKDDVAASRDAMRAGLSTLDVECGFLGRDWRTTLLMARRIKDMAGRYGLNLTSDGTISVINGVQEDESPSEEEAAATAGGR